MLNNLKSHICMVGDVKADRTIVMRDPILMVMKRKHQNGEGKTDEQRKSKFSLHCFSVTHT